MITNLILGVVGLVFSGDSFGTGIKTKNVPIFIFGCVELMIGMYFITAAIGSV